MILCGIKIIETIMAVQQGCRVKTYPRRKAKSLSHWRRMDKKWRKRYGFRSEPCMYWGFERRSLVVHPALMPKIRSMLMPLDIVTDHA